MMRQQTPLTSIIVTIIILAVIIFSIVKLVIPLLK